MELAATENNAGNYAQALADAEQGLQYYASYRDDHSAAQLCSLISILQEKIRALEGLNDPAIVQAMDECALVCQQVEVIDTKYLYYRQVRGGLHVRAAQFLLQQQDLESSQRQLQQAVETLDGYQPPLAVYEAELAEFRNEIAQLSFVLAVTEPETDDVLRMPKDN